MWLNTDITHIGIKTITEVFSRPDRIIRECKKAFEDVVEDFHSLDCIKSHFEVWRREYADCYRDAYIGLCLPKLFNPLVRLQLMMWNPLEVRPVRSLTSTFSLLEMAVTLKSTCLFFFFFCPGSVCKFWVHAVVWVAAVLRLRGEQRAAERRRGHQPAAFYCGEGRPLQTDR